jgi:cytosine deaminase
MVGVSAARQLGVPYGLAVGNEATIILVDAAGPKAALREIGRIVAGWKGGRQSFHNGDPQVHKPHRQCDYPNQAITCMTKLSDPV